MFAYHCGDVCAALGRPRSQKSCRRAHDREDASAKGESVRTPAGEALTGVILDLFRVSGLLLTPAIGRWRGSG